MPRGGRGKSLSVVRVTQERRDIGIDNIRKGGQRGPGGSDGGDGSMLVVVVVAEEDGVAVWVFFS